MTISITTFANQAGPIPLSELDTNFANIVAAIDALGTAANFTPGVAFGGSSAGVTYLFRAGTTYRILNLILFTLDVQLSNKGAAAGLVTITGLPFPVSTAFPVGSAPIVPIISRNVAFAAGYLGGIISAGGTSISVVNPVNAASYNLTSNTEFANNSQIIMTGLYLTP